MEKFQEIEVHHAEECECFVAYFIFEKKKKKRQQTAEKRRRKCVLFAHTDPDTDRVPAHTSITIHIPSLGNAFCFRFRMHYFASFISTQRCCVRRGDRAADCVVVALFSSHIRRGACNIRTNILLSLSPYSVSSYAWRWVSARLARAFFLFSFAIVCSCIGASTERNRIEY